MNTFTRLALASLTCAFFAAPLGCFAAVDAGPVDPEPTGTVANALKIVSSPERPNATCAPANVFGNVICVECTTGPFPSCKTYVCDREGRNCKQTSRRLPPGTIFPPTPPILAPTAP